MEVAESDSTTRGGRMARYRKIDTRIWNDEKFASLSDNGKLVFLFVLTHPHLTALGAMRATLPGLAAELGWTERRLSEAFQEAFRKGLFEHDSQACFVGLPNFLRYNGPESPNVVKSWAAAVDLIPECMIKQQLLQRVKAFAEAFRKPLAKPYRKPFGRVSGIRSRSRSRSKNRNKI